MNAWILLLLGFFTYFILQRSVSRITRTPVWLLWFAIMFPALIWAAWRLIHGSMLQIPPSLVLIPVLVSPFLYWYLIHRGRIVPPKQAATSESDENPASSDLSVNQTAPNASFPRLLDSSEETKLQSCFPWNIYYLQNIEHRPQAVLCRGQLRTASETAYQTIQSNVNQQFGDRFLVAFQEGFNGKPFFALVPNPQAQADPAQRRPAINRPFLMVLLLIATLITTTQAGLQMMQLNPISSFQSWDLLKQGLPYFGIA
jgi:hypothetical protein